MEDYFDRNMKQWFRNISQKSMVPMLLLILLFACASVSCTTLPNVGPFVDATYELKSAVAESGLTVANELQYIDDGGTQYAVDLTEAWKERNHAFTAIAAYADSLQAIVASGQKGNEAAGELADSVKGLSEAAGIALPGSPAALAVATDAIKLIVENINKARAAKSLADAMVKANPAVEETVRLIRADLKDLDGLFRLANKMVEHNYKNSFNEQMGYRKELEDFIQKTNVDAASENDLNKLIKVNELLAGTDGWYAEYHQGLTDIKKRLRIGRALIQTADGSLYQWVNAHIQVAIALQNRQPVNVKSLVEATIQIRELIRKVREL